MVDVAELTRTGQLGALGANGGGQAQGSTGLLGAIFRLNQAPQGLFANTMPGFFSGNIGGIGTAFAFKNAPQNFLQKIYASIYEDVKKGAVPIAAGEGARFAMANSGGDISAPSTPSGAWTSRVGSSGGSDIGIG